MGVIVQNVRGQSDCKVKLRNQVDFLFANKQSFLQVSAIAFGGGLKGIHKTF